MATVIEYLLSKNRALSSTPSITKKKKKIQLKARDCQTELTKSKTHYMPYLRDTFLTTMIQQPASTSWCGYCNSNSVGCRTGISHQR
jgi:hypothetical protein